MRAIGGGSFGVCLLLVVAAAACGGTQKRSAPVPQFSAGQRWSYKTRSVDAGSTLIVLRVEETDRAGVVVHIAIDGVRDANGSVVPIHHLPFEYDAIERSVTSLVESGVSTQGFEEGYDTWREAFNQGKAGVFAADVSDVVGMLMSSMK